MKPKNCLIFGASGQIGRNLIRKLTKNNFKVTAVTRSLHQKGYNLKTFYVKLSQSRSNVFSVVSPCRHLLRYQGSKLGGT